MPSKNYNLLDEQLAVSGIDNSIDPFTAVSAVVGIGSSIFGAASSSSAASRAASEQRKQIKAQYKYNKEGWEMNKDRLNADREFTIEGIEIAQRNEKKLADLKDAASLDNFEYSLGIRAQQMRQNVKQFEKSYELFNQQNTFNDLAANTAKTNAQNKFNEQLRQAAFQNQDMIIESLKQRGAVEAKGVAGNSAGRLASNAVAALGRNQAIIQSQLLSGNRAMKDEYIGINNQKLGADIQAFANLMIPAEIPLMPPDPRATPLSEYQMPRELEDFDYGPKPIKGAMASFNTSAPWLNALSSGIQQIGSMFNNPAPAVNYSSNIPGINLNQNFGFNTSLSGGGGLGSNLSFGDAMNINAGGFFN